MPRRYDTDDPELVKAGLRMQIAVTALRRGDTAKALRVLERGVLATGGPFEILTRCCESPDCPCSKSQLFVFEVGR